MVGASRRQKASPRIDAIVRVIAGVTLHKVVGAGLKTVGVEQPCDSRGHHAAPIVVGAAEHARDHGDLSIGLSKHTGNQHE